MARVCARRAAGIVIGEFFRRSGTVDPGQSAYDRLRFLAQQEGTPAAVRSVCEHFTTRIDKDFNLPIQVDLIADALWIAQTLLGYAKPTI